MKRDDFKILLQHLKEEGGKEINEVLQKVSDLTYHWLIERVLGSANNSPKNTVSNVYSYSQRQSILNYIWLLYGIYFNKEIIIRKFIWF